MSPPPRPLIAVRRAIVPILLALAALSAVAPVGPAQAEEAYPKDLTGWLLVAAPSMPDSRFSKTVIFMVRHNKDGAMGLIVNRVIGEEPVEKFLDPAARELPPLSGRKLQLLWGGPVGTTRAFILHSRGEADGLSVPVTQRVAITTSPEMLRAIARGEGPAHSLFIVGYAGWGPGQLEAELSRKDWVVVPAETEIVFESEMARKWRSAYERRGLPL